MRSGVCGDAAQAGAGPPPPARRSSHGKPPPPNPQAQQPQPAHSTPKCPRPLCQTLWRDYSPTQNCRHDTAVCFFPRAGRDYDAAAAEPSAGNHHHQFDPLSSIRSAQFHDSLNRLNGCGRGQASELPPDIGLGYEWWQPALRRRVESWCANTHPTNHASLNGLVELLGGEGGRGCV